MTQEQRSGRPDEDRARVSRVDAPLRGPFLLLFGSAVLWLTLGSALSLVAAFKLLPAGFGSCEWTSFGRLEAAARNAFFYGWAGNALFALNLWLLSQLGRFEIRNGWMAAIGGLFWNLALIWSTVSVIISGPGAYALLDFPAGAGQVLAVAFALAGLWPVVAYAKRPTGHSFAGQWFVVAAAVSFLLAFVLAQVTVVWAPAAGVAQAVAHSWYVRTATLLWLGGSALGLGYYFVSKVLARPLHAYYLASVAFWTYFLFAGWTAPASLIGSPVPLWVQSAGVVGSMMMLVPVLLVGLNLLGALSQEGGWSRAWNSTALRFISVGVVAILFSLVLAAWAADRSVNAALRFTSFAEGQGVLLLYAGVSMTIFGAAYAALPRVSGSRWPSAAAIHTHFWASFLGAVGSAVSAFAQIGGASQTMAFVGLVSTGLLLAGHLAFAANTFATLLKGSPAPESHPAQD
ncbi:MAG: cbb3-type cytochrome c oxidase subunit I [Opitutales bacterium]